MAEYIEREAIMKFPIRKDRCDKEHANEHFIFGIESVLEYVENLPAADAAPVVHGRWEFLGPNMLNRDCMCGTCSVCKVRSKYIVNTGLCPNCGAKMDGGADDEVRHM